MLYVDTFIVSLWNIGNALIPITAEYVGYTLQPWKSRCYITFERCILPF